MVPGILPDWQPTKLGFVYGPNLLPNTIDEPYLLDIYTHRMNAINGLHILSPSSFTISHCRSHAAQQLQHFLHTLTRKEAVVCTKNLTWYCNLNKLNM